jgi:hypothetical protein
VNAPRPSVLSIVRGADAGAAREADPALDANAYAVADEIDMTLVLKDRGVELGLDDIRCDRGTLIGVVIPAAEPAIDLRALLDSGVQVRAVTEDLDARGIAPAALVAGIEPVTEAELARMIVEHDVTLTTSS